MKGFVLCGVLFLGMAAVRAKDAPSYQSGVLKEMNSVECGFEQKSAKGFVGELVGTDDSHSKTRKTFLRVGLESRMNENDVSRKQRRGSKKNLLVSRKKSDVVPKRI